MASPFIVNAVVPRPLNLTIQKALFVLAMVLSAGCDSRQENEARVLPHRYEECVLLDKAAVNCWHWRPLPDSLSLEGYDGVRYIARLRGIPKHESGPGFFTYRADCLLVGQEEISLEEFIRPGGSISDCDAIWDIFWKSRQDSAERDFKFKQRLMIEERPDGATVSNRPVIHSSSVRVPEGTSPRPNGNSRSRLLKIEHGTKQVVFALMFPKEEDEKSGTSSRDFGAEARWYWATGRVK